MVCIRIIRGSSSSCYVELNLFRLPSSGVTAMKLAWDDLDILQPYEICSPG